MGYASDVALSFGPRPAFMTWTKKGWAKGYFPQVARIYCLVLTAKCWTGGGMIALTKPTGRSSKQRVCPQTFLGQGRQLRCRRRRRRRAANEPKNPNVAASLFRLGRAREMGRRPSYPSSKFRVTLAAPKEDRLTRQCERLMRNGFNKSHLDHISISDSD